MAWKRYSTLLIIMLAGETIFMLPFVLARVFRPTLLTTYDLTHTELGWLFSIYGIVATLSYFFGGILADRFAPRKLIALALCSTAVVGYLSTTFTSLFALQCIYGLYGVTTILPMWAAMIKAIRAWGGETLQGRAFGFFEGGRGLVAALMGSITVWLFSNLLPNLPEEQLTNAMKQEAFLQVIFYVSVFHLVVATLIYFILKSVNAEEEQVNKIELSQLTTVLSRRDVWLQAIIVLCGYVGYKVTDDISLYAYEVLEMSDVESGNIGSATLYFRAAGGIIAGILADKFLSSKVVLVSFLLGSGLSVFISAGIIQHSAAFIHILTMFSVAFAVYGVRGIYFSLIEESNIPMHVTGTAVGIISLIGMSPDIFMGPLMGYFLDHYPVNVSHRLVFGLITIFFLIGAVATWLLQKSNQTKQKQPSEG